MNPARFASAQRRPRLTRGIAGAAWLLSLTGSVIAAEPQGRAAEAQGKAADPQVLFKLGRVSRELGDYKLSSGYYDSYLETQPGTKMGRKVTEEAAACRLLAAGWQLPVKGKDDVLILAARSTLAMTPPDVAEPRLDDLIRQCPGRWEAHALRAQNRFRQGRYSDALKNLETARAKGGSVAKIATADLEAECRKRQKTLEVAKQVQALLARKRKSSAAEMLETAWKNDPSRVEFGIKAAQLHAAKKEFKNAAAICSGLTAYLREHPEHPQAPNAALIRMVGSNCEEGARLQEKIGATKVAATTESRSGGASSSSKSKSGAASGGGKSSGGSGDMSARFMRLRK